MNPKIKYVPWSWSNNLCLSVHTCNSRLSSGTTRYVLQPLNFLDLSTSPKIWSPAYKTSLPLAPINFDNTSHDPVKQDWTCLHKFKQVWTISYKASPIWTSLDLSTLPKIWSLTSLDKFKPIWTISDKLSPIWTSLDKFFLFLAKDKYNEYGHRKTKF